MIHRLYYVLYRYYLAHMQNQLPKKTIWEATCHTIVNNDSVGNFNFQSNYQLDQMITDKNSLSVSLPKIDIFGTISISEQFFPCVI